MRGCLFVVLFAAIVIGAAAWFGSGPLVSAAIGMALTGSGYQASATSISATADPPPRLLLGHADRVSFAASDIDWKTLHARNLALTLGGVDLFGRTADSVRGTIDGAELDDGHGGTATASSIRLSGPLAAVATTITFDESAVRATVSAAAARQFGVAPSDVQLLAPDRLRLVTKAATIEGRLIIDPTGSLALSTTLGSVPLLTVDSSIPLQLRTVAVVDGTLHLDGVLDLSSLLGG